MQFILISSFCFILFFLYDINSIRWKNTFLHKLFFLGCILLAGTTVYAACFLTPQWIIPKVIRAAGWLFLSVFGILLIYTLFFALPFEDTYVDDLKEQNTGADDRRHVYKQGVYALCRHPGVLWLAGFYLSLWLIRPSYGLVALGITATLWNVAYIIFQDHWTFPKLFLDYDSYREDAPFLLPNIRSIRNCLHTLSRKDTKDEEISPTTQR